MPSREAPSRRPVLLAVLAAGTALAACGSASLAELPPPARPAPAPPAAVRPEGEVGRGTLLAGAVRGGAEARLADGRVARVDGRAREVELRDAEGRRVRAAAGAGPTNAVARDRWLWVVDTAGDALLVFRVVGELELVRRVFLPGAPYAIALDPAKRRLFVTLTERNEVVELAAHGRPSELRRFPTVRQPDAVAVDASGRVLVQGAGAALQRFVPGPLER